MAGFIALNSQFNIAAVATPIVPTVTSLSQTIEAKAKENDVDPVLAVKIASCESSSRQFDESGKPLRGLRNPNDIGLFQINEVYHLKTSKALGYDIYTTQGNIDYAMWLLKNEGSQHWDPSKPCWDKAE